MKDLLLGLALLSGPAILFAIFGTSGLEACYDNANAAGDRAAYEEGRLAFSENCVSCHGRLGEGTGEGPPLGSARGRTPAYTAEEFRKVVRDGSLSSGQDDAAMPAFPDMADRDLDGMLTYIEELRAYRAARAGSNRRAANRPSYTGAGTIKEAAVVTDGRLR